MPHGSPPRTMLPGAKDPARHASQQSLTVLLRTLFDPFTSAIPRGQETSRLRSTLPLQVISAGDQHAEADADSMDEVVPGGQDAHSILPAVSENFPSGQGVHGVMESRASSN